jgi:acetone carboxylase gamma subunit
MVRVLEYLEVVGDREKFFRCLKCGTLLGSAKEDYKNFALKRTVPISKAQPAFLTSYAMKNNTFVMREYYCPNCAVMFEVDMVQKDEPQIHSIEPKL